MRTDLYNRAFVARVHGKPVAGKDKARNADELKAKHAEIYRLWCEGKSFSQIAALLGVSRCAVAGRVARMGLNESKRLAMGRHIKQLPGGKRG